MSINLDIACRTCLKEGGDMKSIYDRNKNTQISSMITECTMAKVMDLDGLPTQICEKCVNDITIAFNFKQQCEKSYKKLTEFIYQDESHDALLEFNVGKMKDRCTQTGDDPDVKPSVNIHSKFAFPNEVANDKQVSIKREKNIEKPSLISVGQDSSTVENDIEPGVMNSRENVEVFDNPEKDCVYEQDEFGEDQESSSAENYIIEEIDEEYKEGNRKKSSSTKKSQKKSNKTTLKVDGYNFECDECDAKLETEAKFNFHKSRIHKKKVHQCEDCQKTFTRATHLKRHQFTHSGIRPYTCEICSKSFNRLDHLNLHMQNHSATKSFFCGICHKSFKRSDTLRHHVDSVHSSNPPATPEKNHICDVCQKGFSSPKYLRIHMRVHLERKIACKFCELHFDTKQSLNNHLKLEHVHERPYLCSECGLRFVRNDYLVIHMRRHNGEKPYKCKFCGKGFPRATDLTVHERYHTNEKTHLCTICGKGFQRAYNLLVHTRVHTGERPYECPHCDKKFAQGNDLKAHVRRHTGERYKCEICGDGFIQGYHLTQHKRNQHGIDMKSHIRRVEKFTTETEQPQTNDEQLITEHSINDNVQEIQTSDGELYSVIKIEPIDDIKYSQSHTISMSQDTTVVVHMDSQAAAHHTSQWIEGTSIQ